MSTHLDHRIPDKIYFRIGEVCDLIKVQPHVLRYWESEFPMLAPQKNRAGQRVYRRKDVEMVLRIHDLLYEEKFTIAGARKKLLDDMRRSTSSRVAQSGRESLNAASGSSENAILPRSIEDSMLPYDPIVEPEDSIASETQRAVQKLRRELEDLLTLLNSGC